MTLEKYLSDNYAKGIIDHSLRANTYEGKTTFYIHPQGHDGSTLDYEVKGDSLLTDKEE